MAQSNPQTVLQNTLQTLTKSNTAPASGADLIKEWQSVLKNQDGTEEINDQLATLYDELLNPSPDAGKVTQCLNKLAGQVQAVAGSNQSNLAAGLPQLADALRGFALDLSRAGTDSDLDENQTTGGSINELQNPGDRAQLMFNQTQEALAGGTAAVTTEQGATMIQDWITVVQSEPNAQWIETPLRQLIDALARGDMRQTESLMRDLAGTAQEYANNNPDAPFSKDLTNLATALISFAGPLS